ncbi:hypothetical protein E0H22_15590 [Rhodopseudomonas boonkerdii]|nr:hypothetical protein E0H22_15590 [Rhodopseudomonas boonkerdii]
MAAHLLHWSVTANGTLRHSMSIPTLQIWLRIALVFAMIVGLQRPPIGSESHSHHGLTAVQGEPQVLISADPDGDQKVVVTISSHVQHDVGQADRHDPADHSHVASHLPPSTPVLPSAPPLSTAMTVVSAASSGTMPSFERPPRPFLRA